MRSLVACASVLTLVLGDARRPIDRPIRLVDLVPSTDALAKQNLRFDPRFASAALAYARTSDPAALAHAAASPAARHIIDHATQFDYAVPKSSPRTLVQYLLAPLARRGSAVAVTERSLEFFLGPLLDDPHWVNDVLRYLPAGFRFQGSLFLTFGYDIGVALAPNASLNAGHHHFDGHPRELLYYAIHELHHVGVMTYRPPPRIADLKTCRDLLRLVDYSTELEGMAVLAARARRATDGALNDDDDYVALENDARMSELEVRYLDDYAYLERRRDESLDVAAFAVLDRMSSHERLWYRVGALMAARIERELGREALVGLITRPESRLVATYRALGRR